VTGAQGSDADGGQQEGAVPVEIAELLARLDPAQRQALLGQLESEPLNQGSDRHVSSDDMRSVSSDLPAPIGIRCAAEAPLSFAQRGLWFLHQLRPEDTAYHICYSIEWQQRLDVAALNAALGDLVARHEALRTVLPAMDGQPRQVILPAMRVPLTEVDLASGDSAGEQKWTESAASQPFDLERGPLIRATLIRTGSRNTLVVAVHHIIFDARSTEILLSELPALYAARLAGTPHALSPLPVQFADFAAWQHELLAGPALDEDRAYWHAKLAGAQAVALPADRQRGRMLRSAGSARRFEVPAELRTALAAVGRKHDATLNMVLLAGFFALLYRYTARKDIVLGTSVTSRSRPELEGLIGYFLNTLVLRCAVAPGQSFGALVGQVRTTVLEAFEHSDMPFEQLIEDLAPERETGALPLVPVLFAFSTRGRPSETSASPMTVRGVTSRGARADITLMFSDGPDGLRGVIEYDVGLFDADTIERMCGRLLRLLTAAAAEPGTPLGRLPITADWEAAELARWNATGEQARPADSLALMATSQARRNPASIAISEDDVDISYAELDERSDLIASWLRAAGIGAGQPVAVLLPRSAEQVIALAGVLKAGGAYLPLDPAYPPGRLSFMRADAGASVLITRSDLAALAGLAGGVPGAGGVSGAGRVLLVDRSWEDQIPAGAQEASPPVVVHPDQPAYLLYTSGSTGQPKGVVNTHRGLINRLGWMLDHFAATARDVILYKTPMSFDVSLWELVLPLLTGARMVVARPDGHMDPSYLTGLIERHGVTMIHFVPSMLQAFLAGTDASRCTSLRQVLCSGEALSAAVRDRYYAAGFTAGLDNLYGPTEAAIDVTHWACDPAQPGDVPIGHPIVNTTAYVLDSGGEQLPTGIPGELWIGGSQLALGYVGRPGLTAASFCPDVFQRQPGGRLYRTGDVARRRRDGALEYLGRQDHQVKLRGHRIELAEIEVALQRHELVNDAVVLVANQGGDARLAAYIVPEGTAPSPGALREHLGQLLPAYMMPASYAFVEAMPLTANGKADRNALRVIVPQADRSADYVEPRDSFEAAVADLFAELTGTERVSADDGFFEIGGHSLLALRLRARLHRDFGVDLPLSQVFDDPTVAGLAAKIVKQITEWADAAAAAATAGQ
jgi:amino acid adenylation domain-containing protein